MSSRPVLPFLFAAAGLALWSLLAGLEFLRGYDTGAAGSAVLLLSAWSALYGLWRLPGEEVERQVSPAEWKAWIGTAFMAVAIGYFIARMDAFQVASLADSPRAREVGSNLALLLIAWTVLSGVVAARWKDRVQEDERDREIERLGCDWGRGAVTAMIVGLALLLGFSPAERLDWATLPMVASLLLLALMVGTLFENAAVAVRHLLDRR